VRALGDLKDPEPEDHGEPECDRKTGRQQGECGSQHGSNGNRDTESDDRLQPRDSIVKGQPPAAVPRTRIPIGIPKNRIPTKCPRRRSSCRRQCRRRHQQRWTNRRHTSG